MPINVESIMNDFSKYKDGNNIICNKETFRNILDNSKPNRKIRKTKKTKCSFFVWLDEKRKGIRSEYFSDFEDVSHCSLENKMNYYKRKGLPLDKVVKEGKPRIVSLVTTKAGIIWKSLSDEQRGIYEEKARVLKENTVQVEVEVAYKPKKKRGRPKKNTSETIVEAIFEQFNDNKEDEDILKVEEIEYNGKTYYLDINNNDIYDPETSELIGKKENNQIIIN